MVETRARVGGGLHSGEQYLIRLLGEDIGGRFHVARSSGDLSSVAINTLQREKLLALMRAVNRLRRTLIDLARGHTDTILPGYSFGQHAQPMTLAHLWLSWAANLARDFDRLHGAYRRDQHEPRRRGHHGRLGFSGESRAHRRAARASTAVHENCADAILELNADDSLDTPAVIAILYHSMAKWADDIIQWTTSEYAFVDIPDRYCGTSSIMMQKKNVIGPAEVKGASAEALGCFVTSYHALKGTTGLPITERYYALDMLWRVADNAVRDLGWFCDLLPALEIRKEHMLEQAWRHWATATDLAGALVRERDLPWRTAHQIVGILIRLCERARTRARRCDAGDARRGGHCLPRCARRARSARASAPRSIRGDSSPSARCAAARRRRNRCASASWMVQALARAAGAEPAAVQRAFMLRGDLKAVAEAALRDGPGALDRFRLEVGRPVRPDARAPREGRRRRAGATRARQRWSGSSTARACRSTAATTTCACTRAASTTSPPACRRSWRRRSRCRSARRCSTVRRSRCDPTAGRSRSR